ncbi:Rho guanine nucleotide exchange factor 28 [Merluccius polli]|uniref:Rho guanine nucleotide exchange factor 28 n=1 Tax=Merluccius polli TaxID=89951 RepID=A0AA47P4S4_MERPO|nr:Rho guanine nucleotide exchange factor 28 [Merluccius polli]
MSFQVSCIEACFHVDTTRNCSLILLACRGQEVVTHTAFAIYRLSGCGFNAERRRDGGRKSSSQSSVLLASPASQQQGQVEAYALFQDPIVGSEEADFYVVLEGSTLTHVAVARQRSGEGCLWFTVPGMFLRVTTSQRSSRCPLTTAMKTTESGRVGVQRLWRTSATQAQEVAEYLHANRWRLEPQSHLELQRLCSTRSRGWTQPDEEPTSGRDDEGQGFVRPSPAEDAVCLRELDAKVTQAMANMDILQQWRNRPSELQPNGDRASHSEDVFPLHLQLSSSSPERLSFTWRCARTLLHLSRFLLHQPKGHRALTLPNQEGETPLQLAQKSREHTLFRVLATPLVPASGHVVGGHCLWSDSSGVLRFNPGTDQLTLSAPRAPGPRPHDIITALRHKQKDPSVLRTITSLSSDHDVDDHGKGEIDQSDGDLCADLPCVKQHRLVDSVFTEQLVLSLDDDEEEEPPSLLPDPLQSNGTQDLPALSVHPVSLNRTSILATDNTHPRLTEYAGQHIGGVTTDSSATDFRARDREHPEVCATDTPPPKPHHQSLQPEDWQRPSPPPNHSTPEDLKSRRASPTLEVEDLSPSLVTLEVDSEEDGVAVPPPPFSDQSSAAQSGPDGGGSGMDTFDPSPDLTCTRTKSASSACDSSSQESCDQGIRLRSYSYSSTKLSLRPSRIARDSPPPSSSPEQRATSLPEPHEKREIRLRRRAQSADDEGDTGLTESLQHLTLSEFLKEIEEEEFDKYNIPSKADSDKYKVIRTFSFLKNRMSSTRNKSKGKGKDREAKERQLNGHQFATGSCLGPTVCLICEKPASGRDLLHCSRCMSMVHKGCKDSVPPCLKKPQDKYAVSMVKNRTASLPQNFTIRDSPPLCVHPNTMSLPVISPKEKKEGALLFNPLSGSFSNTSERQSESFETESDSWRIFNQSDDLQQTAASSTSTDSSIGEDCVDSFVSSDLTAGEAEFEAESWSLSVEHKFCKKQDKQEVKRQDVIYELMQTEIHHLQTLHIMAEVFRRGVREEVQLDAEAQERLFPCLDQLVSLHHAFFSSMRERRHSSAASSEQTNYLIERVGDILLHQFTDENAERMKQVYGEFCSHHNDAVSFFKELQQNNKRFQNFVKQQSNNSLVRRREIPECILLVTQRITKYPVLLERILKYTKEATQEHTDLLKALVQIREVIAAVDLSVSKYEQGQRLQEVWNRMENRSAAKLKSGHIFRKQDMMPPGQVLKHQGPLLWKTATGRLKDVMALLFTDTLIFLQEKDQKYMFAAVDQKPPVISLQKLIVREVANEERGMFLISASAAGPEMYEVHTSSKEERNTWMRLIREAVESCPEEEEDYTSESEDEKRAAEARVQKIHKLQESLMSRDQQICTSLEEKLQIYAEVFALQWKMDASQLESRIRVQPHSDEVPQAAVLLAAAVQETENLKAVLSPMASYPCCPSQDAVSDAVFPASPLLLSPLSPSHDPDSLCEEEEEEEADETEWAEAVTLNSLTHLPNGGELEDINNIKVAQSVQSLTQLLYSLQAVVSIQDSCHEVQKLLLSEAGRPSLSSSTSSTSSSSARAGPSLQEQEKQRNLEKRREEAAAALRLQGQLRLERQRWEKECQARDGQQGALEAQLEERERRCHLQSERLRRERQELEDQLEEYQQSLERLRDGQRSVERERRRLDAQQRLLRGWGHGRQRSLPSMVPAMVIPLGEKQVTDTGQPGDYNHGGSVFVNEAAFVGTAAANNRLAHHKRNDPSAHNSLNTLLVRSSQRKQASPRPDASTERWPVDTGFFYTPTETVGVVLPTATDYRSHGDDGCTSAPTSPVAGDQYPHPPLADPQLDLDTLVSMETESEEEGREEDIVYL